MKPSVDGWPLNTHANMYKLIYRGSLNVIGPHKIIGSGPTRRYDLFEIGMAFLEEVCHSGGGF